MGLIGIRVVALIVMSVCSQHVLAEQILYPKLEDPLPGKPDTTYLDMAKMIAPDLIVAAYGYKGHKMMRVSSITGEPGQYTPSDYAITWLSAVPFTSETAKHMLVLFDVSPDGPDA